MCIDVLTQIVVRLGIGERHADGADTGASRAGTSLARLMAPAGKVTAERNGKTMR